MWLDTNYLTCHCLFSSVMDLQLGKRVRIQLPLSRRLKPRQGCGLATGRADAHKEAHVWAFTLQASSGKHQAQLLKPALRKPAFQAKRSTFVYLFCR